MTDEERDIQAIHRLTGEWTAATASKDIPKLLSLRSNDVVFLPGGAPPVKGKAAVEAMYRMFFAQFSRVEQAAAIDEIRVTGDWAFSWGADTLTQTPTARGGPIVMTGHGLSILKREADGAWRFARGINNMRPQTGSR